MITPADHDTYIETLVDDALNESEDITIHRKKFMASVELLIQQEFGVTQQQRSRAARDTLYAIAVKEYQRLGGLLADEMP